MTNTEAAENVALLVAMYPTPGWPKERVKLYAVVIGDLDCELTRAGVLEMFRTRIEDRPPMPAEIRRLIAAKRAASVASPYLEPDEAWALVVASFTTVGGYREFPEDHALLAETVRALGWQTLCRSDNPEADRAHFLQLYRQRLERGRRDDAASEGAVPHAAMGARPSVVHREQPTLEQRATGADAKALVASVSQALGRRPMTMPTTPPGRPPPMPALTAAIDDPAEITRRTARRRELLAQHRSEVRS